MNQFNNALKGVSRMSTFFLSFFFSKEQKRGKIWSKSLSNTLCKTSKENFMGKKNLCEGKIMKNRIVWKLTEQTAGKSWTSGCLAVDSPLFLTTNKGNNFLRGISRLRAFFIFLYIYVSNTCSFDQAWDVPGGILGRRPPAWTRTWDWHNSTRDRNTKYMSTNLEKF